MSLLTYLGTTYIGDMLHLSALHLLRSDMSVHAMATLPGQLPSNAGLVGKLLAHKILAQFPQLVRLAGADGVRV